MHLKALQEGCSLYARAQQIDGEEHRALAFKNICFGLTWQLLSYCARPYPERLQQREAWC